MFMNEYHQFELFGKIWMVYFICFAHSTKRHSYCGFRL